MTLTKEILEEIISIDDKYTSRHRDEDIVEILKNQELAKQIEEAGFRLVTERDFVIMVGIIERLKKRIPELRDEDEYVKSDSFWSYDAVADELEKIMGVKND